jgi:hypothetical protein
MTKLLDEAIAKVRTLSAEQQDRAAEMLLAFAEEDAQAEARAERWLEENRAEVEAYNNRVAGGAILSDRARLF